MNSAEELIAAIAAGQMVVLVDDEDRENEGDLVIAASHATPSAINFMAQYGRGLICLAMERPMVERLNLPPMARHNSDRHGTAFTVSIEAREGVSTGISAADRAHTIQLAINPATQPSDIVTPGHVFPLIARDGGVLVRAGHTEAAADLARLAGLPAAGVICEIMADDGTMARLPQLIPYAAKHGLLIGTIADLIAYRRRTEKLVKRLLTRDYHHPLYGQFDLHLYASENPYAEHLVLVKNSQSLGNPALVRMHALNLLDDLLLASDRPRAGELQAAMAHIAKAGAGLLVLLREPQANALSQQLMVDEAAIPGALRDYGVGAQILLDLGIKQITLLSNSQRAIPALDGYGLKILGRQIF